MLAGKRPVKNIAAVTGRETELDSNADGVNTFLGALGLITAAVWKCEKHRVVGGGVLPVVCTGEQNIAIDCPICQVIGGGGVG